MAQVLVITHSPSPYQVELFDEIAKLAALELVVAYLHSADPARSWSRKAISHQHVFLDADERLKEEARTLAGNADLVVVNYYQHPFAKAVMRRRTRMARPWSFWGERPGVRHPWLGRLARAWILRDLHRSRVPIWGIGEFAIEGYRQEFGGERQYLNIPYYSDLHRFSTINKPSMDGSKRRVILFSGALIPRKGVDLLAKAFSLAAPKYPMLRLHLMGMGELEKELREILQPVISQVRFIGFMDWNDLPGVYAEADILCVPSRHDGWGLVVPEGLASGLPVIATKKMGAALDLIRDGENGWLIEAGDIESIHIALIGAASLSNEELAGMSNRARLSIVEHDVRHGANLFCSACEQVINEWGR